MTIKRNHSGKQIVEKKSFGNEMSNFLISGGNDNQNLEKIFTWGMSKNFLNFQFF